MYRSTAAGSTAGGIGDGAERSVTGNHRPNLFKNLFSVAVFQRHTDENREGRQDFPVGTAVPYRIDRGPNGLDMALGIGERSGFLHGGGGREHHMGERSRFRKKQFLAHKEIEFAQRLFDSGLGRKAPDRIFSNNEEAFDDPGLRTVDHLNKCGPCRQWEILFPYTSNLRARVLIGEVVRARQHCRNRAHFNRPLIVILFRQGSEAAATGGQLPGQEKQIQEIETDAITALAAEQISGRQARRRGALRPSEAAI